MAAASAPAGCWHSGFAALWILLNFYPKRRSFEVVCPSPAGLTSYFDILGVAVCAGTSIPLSPSLSCQPLDASVLADLKTQVSAVEFLRWTCWGWRYKACHRNPILFFFFFKFFCFYSSPPSQ